jgi:potassium efflux system protein
MTVPAGSIICRQNEIGESFFIMLSGKFGIYVNGIFKTSVDTPNSVFGELSLENDEPRMASIITEAESTLLSVTKTCYRTHLSKQLRQ